MSDSKMVHPVLRENSVEKPNEDEQIKGLSNSEVARLEAGLAAAAAIGGAANKDEVWVDLGNGGSAFALLEGDEAFHELPIKEGDTQDPVESHAGKPDVWDMPALADNSEKWSELSLKGKLRRVLVGWILKPCTLLLLLYVFICSLSFLSSSFRLLGGKAAGKAFSDSELLQNPVAGLMIGILATVLLQSSSTSTSIIVTMVASGILEVSPAIPIVMGANIGTSVTNTIVSMAQSADQNEFRRAFGGATVHDMFNWLSVLVLLPLEAATGYLYHLTSAIVASYNLGSQQSGSKDMLKTITKPFTDTIIMLDKKLIEKIAIGQTEYAEKSMIKQWCVYETQTMLKNVTTVSNVTGGGSTGSPYMPLNLTEEREVNESVAVGECSFLFHNTGMSDTFVGLLLLILSLTVLCTCLIMMVKLLNSILKGKIAVVIKKTLNSDLPGKCSYFTGYIALMIGAGMTILVQSSSVFTSAMTPLVGIGVIKLERMYPLTLGSNIGTTATGLLAAMAASGDKLEAALQIALCHLFFNVSGILIFYPVPFMRFPIRMAKIMGNTTAKYRWFAIFYLIMMFFVAPGLVFSLSMAGQLPMTIVVAVFLNVFGVIIIINIMQEKCPSRLPRKLRNWDFLPECLHSLDPLDRLIKKLFNIASKFCPCSVCAKKEVASKPQKVVVVDDKEEEDPSLSMLKTGAEEPKSITDFGTLPMSKSITDLGTLPIYAESGYGSAVPSAYPTPYPSQAPSRVPSSSHINMVNVSTAL